jgi:hypothetical protein
MRGNKESVHLVGGAASSTDNRGCVCVCVLFLQVWWRDVHVLQGFDAGAHPDQDD